MHKSHPRGEQQFWRDDMVKRYEYQQHLLSEKKEEIPANVVRIINYFCKVHSITAPKILNIGCGPGTKTTLCKYALDGISG